MRITAPKPLSPRWTLAHAPSFCSAATMTHSSASKSNRLSPSKSPASFGFSRVSPLTPNATNNTLSNTSKSGATFPRAPEILGGQSIPGLWSVLGPKLKDSAPKAVAAAAGSSKPSVYLIFDATLSAESEAASHLSGILNDRNLHVIQSKNYDDHQDLMNTSDAALLLRTTRPEPDDWWLRLVAHEVILSTRFASKVLVLADKTRLKLNAGDIPVLTYSQPFSAQTLDPFIEKLQRARGANAGGR